MAKAKSPPAKDRVCVGAFAGSHGVHGHAKVKTFTAQPEDVAAYGPVESEDATQTFTLKVIRSLKPELLLVSIKGLKNREEAQSLAGTRLYVDRSCLPPPEEDDEFYYSDLIGLKVTTDDGRPMGKVSAVQNFGAGDVIEIREIPGHKGSHLVPFTKDAIPTINIEIGLLIISALYYPGTDSSIDKDGS